MDLQADNTRALTMAVAGDALFTDRVAGDVTLAAGGDHSAFERLVDMNKSLVCSIALAIVRDWETSEEIAQDVFVAAWTQLGKLRNPASFLPWLRQVTRNRSYDSLRRRIGSRARIQSLQDCRVVSGDAENSPACEDPRRAMIHAKIKLVTASPTNKGR